MVRWGIVTPLVRFLEILLRFPAAPPEDAPEPWRSFVVATRDALERWCDEIPLPDDFASLSADAAVRELDILLRYVLRTPASRDSFLCDLEQRARSQSIRS